MICLISGVLVTSSPEKKNLNLYKYAYHGQLKLPKWCHWAGSWKETRTVGSCGQVRAGVSRCEHCITLGLYKHRMSSLKAAIYSVSSSISPHIDTYRYVGIHKWIWKMMVIGTAFLEPTKHCVCFLSLYSLVSVNSINVSVYSSHIIDMC